MTNTINQENKQLVWKYWQALHSAAPDNAISVLRHFTTANHVWHGFDPVGDLAGESEFVTEFWGPLRAAFANLERKTWLFFGGQSNGRIDGSNDGRMWVTGTGILEGTFTNDYMSIPATGERVKIRWGEFCRLENGRIAETFFLIDVIDLMQQAGINVLPPSRGKAGLYPPPEAGDGMLLDAGDAAESRYSLEHIRRFIFDGLNAYDESNLDSMGMADFFAHDIKWYGPAGIGACLSFADFQTRHQAPWLHAFPDRSVQNLDALIAEGAYSGAPGWNGVLATHRGDYLGYPATGNHLGFNGLDWWKRNGEQYAENWVFVDMVHLFRQLGVNLLEPIGK
jgi:predicted ester cyclase